MPSPPPHCSLSKAPFSDSFGLGASSAAGTLKGIWFSASEHAEFLNDLFPRLSHEPMLPLLSHILQESGGFVRSGQYVGYHVVMRLSVLGRNSHLNGAGCRGVGGFLWVFASYNFLCFSESIFRSSLSGAFCPIYSRRSITLRVPQRPCGQI